MTAGPSDPGEFPPSCPGLHLPPEQPGCVPLRWLPETRRTAHARVIRHTCDGCRAVSYELCAAGGLMFIRRTDRTEPTPQVHETEWLITSRARQMWRDLLLGIAR